MTFIRLSNALQTRFQTTLRRASHALLFLQTPFTRPGHTSPIPLTRARSLWVASHTRTQKPSQCLLMISRIDRLVGSIGDFQELRSGVVTQLSLRTSSPKHLASVIWTFCSLHRGKSAGRSQAHMQVPRHGRNHRCCRRHLIASGRRARRACSPLLSAVSCSLSAHEGATRTGKARSVSESRRTDNFIHHC
jgi:hypothetical protein